jgi:hypothetical protein
MAKKRCIGGGGHDLFSKGDISQKIRPKMTFAAPISFFKSISIVFGGAGLIFEGLTNRGGRGDETFCHGLPGVPACHASRSVAASAAKRMEDK